MAATFDGTEIAPLVAPFRGECPRCAVEVLVVDLAGEDVVLEIVEVMATMRCPRCAGNVAQGNMGADPRSKPCWRCGGTQLVGQDLPSVGVAVGEDGLARPYTGSLGRGEGLHVFHSCA